MIFNNGARCGVADATASSRERGYPFFEEFPFNFIILQFYPLPHLNRDYYYQCCYCIICLTALSLSNVSINTGLSSAREYHARSVTHKICTKRRKITKKCLACNLAENDRLTPSFETRRRHQSGSLKKRSSTLFLFPRG